MFSSVYFIISIPSVSRKIKSAAVSINCGTINIVYLISCKKCNVQYVGSTFTEFKVRFRNHTSAMLTDKKVCEMAVHFNENKHEFKDLEFVAIEKVDLVNGENASNPLLTREAYWMAQLCTINNLLTESEGSTGKYPTEVLLY